MPLVVEEDGKRRQLDLRELPALARVPRHATSKDFSTSGCLRSSRPEVPGQRGAGRLRHRERGDRPRPHRAALRRGRLPDRPALRPAAPPHRRRRRQDRRGRRPLRRDVVQGRRPADHPRPEGARPPPPRRALPPQLPLLLALRPAAPLLRHRELVRAARLGRRSELVERNRTIDWRPEHVGEGRFGNWLENVVDWALSRSRYWGTPLPVWQCDACSHQHVDRLLPGTLRASRASAPARTSTTASSSIRTGRSSTRSPGLAPRAREKAPCGAWSTSSTPGSTPAPCPSPSTTTRSRTASCSRVRRASGFSPPTSSARRWTRRAAGSTRCTRSGCCSSTRWPSNTASCSATSTTSRAARCRSGWATSSTRWG